MAAIMLAHWKSRNQRCYVRALFLAVGLVISSSPRAEDVAILRGGHLAAVAVALRDFEEFLKKGESGCKSLSEFSLEVRTETSGRFVVEFVRLSEGKGCGATYSFAKPSERRFERVLHK